MTGVMQPRYFPTVSQKRRDIRHYYFIEWKNKGSSGAVTRTKQLPSKALLGDENGTTTRPQRQGAVAVGCEKTRPLQTLACKNKLLATASFFPRFTSSLPLMVLTYLLTAILAP